MRKRKNKSLAIGILCCMLVFMGIGYAALSQTLNIGTTAKVTGSWNIYISSATVKEQSDADMKGTKITDNKTTDISLNVSFKKPSDYITYDITVENAGTIDAKLDEITMTPPSNVIDGTEEKMFLMETKNLTKGSVLKAGGTTTFQMTLRFNEKATTLPSADEEFTFGLKLNYVQLDSINFDTSGTGGGTIPAEAPDFTVDSNGTIVAYNESKITTDADGYLIVPEKNSEGKVIKAVGKASFVKSNITEFHTDSEDGIVINATTEAEYLQIKAKVEEVLNGDGNGPSGFGGGGSGSGTGEMVIYWSENKSIPEDASTDLYYCDLAMDEIQDADVAFEKIDLTKATSLEEIGDDTFSLSNLTNIKFNEGLKRIGNGAFEDTELSGSLEFPTTLESIGDYAFSKCEKLSSVKIFGNIKKIGEDAFNIHSNIPLTITIKKVDSSGITFGDNWYSGSKITVVYDPS